MRLILAMLAVLSTATICFAPESEFGKISTVTAAACLLYNVERSHIDALFAEESGFHNIRTYEPRIKKYAHGPGQILYNTAKDVGYKGPECGLDDINISIPLKVKFVKKLWKRYHGDWSKICSHYKTGRSHYVRYGEAHNKIYQEFVKANCS
jgi:soluble lytic murein transglycosylase-like protein